MAYKGTSKMPSSMDTKPSKKAQSRIGGKQVNNGKSVSGKSY